MITPSPHELIGECLTDIGQTPCLADITAVYASRLICDRVPVMPLPGAVYFATETQTELSRAIADSSLHLRVLGTLAMPQGDPSIAVRFAGSVERGTAIELNDLLEASEVRFGWSQSDLAAVLSPSQNPDVNVSLHTIHRPEWSVVVTDYNSPQAIAGAISARFKS